MEKLADSIEFAERQVALRKQAALAEWHAVETKARKSVTSPKIIAGLLVGAVVIAYFLANRRPKKDAGKGKPASPWQQFMPLLQVVLPMVGAALGKKADAPPKKKVVVVQNPAPRQ